jgi:hypothetical protein
MSVPRIADLIHDPSWLLHRIDVERDRLLFVPTTQRLLRHASFLDGRTAIDAGAPVEVPIEAALETDLEPPAAPDRFIFHVSFCGSTLLARMLDRPGAAMVLREPHCLVDLADWKAALDRRCRGDSRFEPLLRLACATLRTPWAAGEPVVVKPSNWVNNLLGPLCTGPSAMRPLFVTMPPRAFLRAVFRGGRDRIGFTARAAGHFASGDAAAGTLLGAAVRGAPEPLGQAANLVLLAYHLQLRRFRAAADAGGATPHFLTIDAIEQTPLAAATQAAAALGLDIADDQLAAGADWLAARDAKRPGEPYSAAEHRRADAMQEEAHGALFDAAFAWAEDYFVLDPVGEAEAAARRAG